LIDLESRLYLLWRKLGAEAVYPCHSTFFELPWFLVAAKLVVGFFFNIAQFGCQIIVLVNFFFCVPEPFVDLVLR
jgi:hypothetical protein